MKVTKRNGQQEELNLDNIHAMLQNCKREDLGRELDVSVSDTALNAHIKFADGMATSDIQQTLIKSAAEKIDPKTPDYSIFAGRLLVTEMRKEVYGQFQPIRFLDYIHANVASGLYDPKILELYSEEEIDMLESVMDYNNDFARPYSSIVQLDSKYLIKDAKTDRRLEMVQETFMLIAMTIFAYEENCIELVIKMYNALKDDKISLPTPIISGVRTQLKMFSSCCLLKMGDTTESILASEYALSLMTANRAGIGVDMAPVRGIMAPVKNNTVKHTGALPLLKSIEAASKQFTQNSLRSGATVVNYPVFNWEIMDVLEYKNNQGSNTNRARFIDYTIGLPDIFLKRVLAKEDWTLFSSEDVPLLLSTYGSPELFEPTYEAYEKDETIRKKTLPAVEVFNKLIKERVGTGRIYIHFIDNVNRQGMFDEQITQTNLCLVGDTKVPCFIQGKEVIKDIKDIEVGDKVLSKKVHTGRTTYEKVTAQALMHKDAELYEVEDLSTGYKIKCTGDHKIYTSNRGYVEARNLTSEDSLDIQGYRVYQITNTINNKVYIGYTRHNIDHRFHVHCNNAQEGKDTYLYRAIRKYGKDAFKVEELEFFLTRQEAEAFEVACIKELTPDYNLTAGGTGGWSVPQHKYAEWKKKVIKATTKENNPKWSGWSDEDILDRAYIYFKENSWNFKAWIDFSHREYGMPKTYSKNRFSEYQGASGSTRFKEAYSDKFNVDISTLKYTKTPQHKEALRASTIQYYKEKASA